ncbi:acetyl-CoA C-acetyltransferase [Marinomonas mediterranea]|jgi:acetyl-CoA acetyltransferase (EC 2.3.1.9)|uniref:Acetyl-CoA acetyltransferase n=1 Tax=Marinomonas mediterranea (strain ATCC 700492 / JCM 21426 / NBRC 103028 / MMB-1) TaxID=717774 RepID=F2JZE9_MARM1|nr:acetyl-CoA C-acetyltransferase [Marinomonas mediterranea]ADZ89732.1 acetyl-CoA acetyltransferase [Marinomonas mediterranea MMB-1]WCN07825.1 acetyl-CoA C-acyltransferase [Marinomonas mediterranea]WCN11919.1 acetyl-CoA C-acyltransferase [Marinomonas mediterranea]WCN15957.1 acetyl-CoA C-acyltransferase [Marinomonas mediterranea MMB-1]
MKAVIVAAARSPIGAFNGALSTLSAVEIGTQVLSGLLNQTPALRAHIDEVILGQVLSAGCGQNPARQTALHAGLAQSVSAMTINKVCGSGLKAVQLAAQSILNGDAKMVVAGGQESMSQAAHVLPKSRNGKKMGDWTLLDSMVTDGLWDAFNDYHMGQTAENIASKWNITREEQDRFAAKSQQKAAAAQAAGRFIDEILPISIPQRKGEPLNITEDEQIRPDSNEASLGKLRAAFSKDGTVTAGNASTLNDGAAMVVVTSDEEAQRLELPILATIEASASVGVAPEIMGTGPIASSNKALQKAQWNINDLDLIEANEAFAVQAMCVNQELGLDQDKVNVNGGAIALGHPIGASGCRILVSLLHEMRKRDAQKGLATLCVGGGMGVSLLVSR